MTTTKTYNLRGKDAIPCDIRLWEGFIHLAKSQVKGNVVSTIFSGLDHQFGEGPPLLFETLIFRATEYGDYDYQERCSTWEQAIHQHLKACKSLDPNYKSRMSWFERLIFFLSRP